MSLLERNCSRKGAGSWEEAGTFPSEPPLGIHLMSAEVHVIPAAGSGDCGRQDTGAGVPGPTQSAKPNGMVILPVFHL